MFTRTRKNSRGFVFSLEALIALVLFASFLGIAYFVPEEKNNYLTELALKNSLNDSLYFLDRSGFALSTFDSTLISPAEKSAAFYSNVVSSLPASTRIRLQVSAFDTNAQKCILSKKFENCFTRLSDYPSQGASLPSGKNLVHEKMVFISKQPPQSCSIGAAFSSQNSQEQKGRLLFEEYKTPSLHFASSPDVNIFFGVSASKTGSIACDQNIHVDLNAYTFDASYGRKPADIMLVLDKSGSMTWDGMETLATPIDIFVSGNYAYIADAGIGIIDVNIANPATPTMLGKYHSINSSGNGVYVDKNIAYLANGNSGFNTVDMANRASPSTLGLVSSIGTASKVTASGNYAYVTTTSNGSAGFNDLIVTGTSNADLLIGKGPTNDITAAQSFIPASNSIRSIQLRLKRTNSSPSGDLTVSLRQTLSGANLATATITKGTLSTSYANYTVTFDSDVSLDSSLTYYIVLSTSSTSSTKYYYWAAVTPSIYSGGNAYNNSAPLSTTDAIFTTNHNARKGMQVFNVSNPRSIIHLSSIPTTDPHEVFSLGNYIYLADGTAGLKIIDVNNPLNPVLVGSLGTTNATGIYVSGNYAYIADMGGGLRIINISTKSSPSLTSTFTAPSTTYDVTGYSDGNVYLASNTYFVGVDVTNPSFPRQSVSYMTSYSYTNLAVSNNWAFNIASTNSYLITFNIYTGPKMNQVEASAKQFLDYTGWKSASDQIGLVTFASSSSLDQQLLKITDTNKVTLRNKIDAIVPGGNTAIGDGITTARTELTGTRATKGSVRFEILLSDGQSNTGSSPITAAQSAHDQNIKIYTIAYGGDADFATLQNVALITGGKYYIAGDINALQEVFEFIAIDIGESLYGGLFGVAYDSNLQMPVVNCFDFTDTNGGICSKIGDTNYLTYNIGTIDRNHTWEGHFEMNIPCSSKESCSSSRLILPFAGTKFYWKDVNLLQRTPLTWDSNVSLDFNYRDLSLTALGASVSGIGTISIDLNAKNSGILSASSTTIDFLSDDPYSGSLVGQVPINSLARSASQVLLNNRVLSNGWIYAIINRSGAIRECPGNNIVSIYCSGSLKTNFFVVDVWAWTE